MPVRKLQHVHFSWSQEEHGRERHSVVRNLCHNCQVDVAVFHTVGHVIFAVLESIKGK